MNQIALQMALQDSSKFGRVGAGGVIFANFILWFSSFLFYWDWNQYQSFSLTRYVEELKKTRSNYERV